MAAGKLKRGQMTDAAIFREPVGQTIAASTALDIRALTDERPFGLLIHDIADPNAAESPPCDELEW